MDVWEVPQSSRSRLDIGFLIDVGPMRAGLVLGKASETRADITWRANIPATSQTRDGLEH